MKMFQQIKKDVMKEEVSIGGIANARVARKPDKLIVASTIGSIGW